MMFHQNSPQGRQGPPPPPAAPVYNLKLPYAAFVLIVVSGGILAGMLAYIGNATAAIFVFGLGIVGAVTVALLIIVSDRQDFREMNKREQIHAHNMQRIATLTERYRIIGPPVAEAPQALPPADQTLIIDGAVSTAENPAWVPDSLGHDVSVELIRAVIDIYFADPPFVVKNLRDDLKRFKPGLQFRAIKLTDALRWMREKDIVDEKGNWLMDETGARGVLDEAVAEQAALLSLAK